MRQIVKQFLTISQIEFLLFLREFFGCFFTLVFPTLLLVLFGSIYGNEPFSPGEPLGMIDLSVPAYSAMVIGVTGLMTFPLTLAGYKEKKIYKRFDATPVGKRTILLSQTMICFLMSLIGIAVLLAAGKLLYQIQIRGSFFPICISILLSEGTMFSMGFLFTAVARDIKITNLLCYLFYYVMLFLSGATIPDQLFSESVKKAAAFLPMTYTVDLMQGAFAGDGLMRHGKELVVLGTLTVVFTLVGALCYRGKDWS